MNPRVFTAAADYAADVTSRLGSEALRLPTPCDDWDTTAVVLHLVDVAAALEGLVDTGELVMPPREAEEPTDPVDTFHEALAHLRRTVTSASSSERATAAMQAGAIELTLHAWDIGVARDSGHRIPAHLADEVLDLATSLVTADARGTNFAAPLAAPLDAPASDRLTAFLGRQPASSTRAEARLSRSDAR